MCSTFIIVIGWSSLSVCALMTGLIIFKSVQHFRDARERSGMVIVKAIVALITWLILSMVNLIALTGYAAGETIEPEPPLEFGTTELSIVGAFLLYALAGCGLVYWTNQQRKVHRRK